jgi:LysR family hca operon transcriptional activator
MARAISSGSPTRPSGTPVASAAFLSGVPVKRLSIPVSVGPGATALTRTPKRVTGHEIDWLPEAIRLLRDELPNIEITISSQYSPDLAGALVRGKLDVAFLRPETQTSNLVFKLVTKEPLVVVLPSDHRLASHEAINPQDIAGETFISVSNTAPVLRLVIDDYLRRSGIDIKPDHEVDHLAMAVSLVASTRGVALLPAYAQNVLPRSLVSRPLRGDVPTIDLVVGYSKTNTSPILKLFLSRIDDLIARVSKKTH